MANKLSELNLSEEEVQRLTEAFKKEEFKKLFAEYAEEISNPENRKRYEAEIAQLEAERGMDIKFVQPEPGHAIKTTVNGEIKAFINICKNDHIEKPSANKQKTQDGRYGLQWSIPHSFAPPREDTDKSGNKCRVFDVVFHPDTYRMGETNVRFRKMLHDTAFDGIERQFDVSTDRKNMKFPKMKFKGIPSATVIRSKSGEKSNGIDKDDIMNNFPYPYDEKTTEEKSREMEKKFEEKNNENESSNGNATTENKADPYTTPKYNIKHRSEIELDQFRNAPDARPSTRPKELVVEIDLPLLKSAAPVDLDIFEKRLFLKSEEPAKYKLDVCLPYPVDENNGSAKFDKSKKKLIVTLPVLADEMVQNFFEEIWNVGQISEERADGQSSSNEQGNPLIEVLSSSKNSEASESAGSEITASLRDSQEVMNDVNERNKNITDKDIWTPHDNCPDRQNIRYTMPSFDYDQDVGTLSLVMHVKNIEIDSVVKIFSPDDQKQIHIRFVSMGSGCFPVHYSILLKFEEGCNIVPEDCTVDVSAENLVLVLAKAKLSWSWWDKFTAGVDENNLKEKYFITEKTLKAELDELGGAPIVPAEQVNNPELRVTEMNSDHVTVEIKDKEDSAGSDQASPESEIEIIHERVPPKLHSILKQRSRTTSESSDEVFSSSFSRENSITTSESPISEGDEEHASGRKKSVSFSEQVDHTSYKSNSTVSTLHNTLKNRRKKARQREEKKSKGKGGRRRRTSSGGSYSSDDLSSSGKPEEFQLGDADLDPHTKVTKKGTGDVRRVSPVDDEVKSAHSPPETKSRGKSKQIVAQEEAAATDTNVLENKKGLRENCKRVQKGNAPRKPSDVTQIGSEPPVKPDGNSITNGHDASAKETDIIDEKDVFREPKLNHGGNNAPCVNVSSDENSSDKKSRNRKRKNKNKQVWVISGGSEDEDDKSEENKVANVAEDEEQKVAKADTKLKWEESKHQADSNEHKTQCAFQFSNSLMYDLDED